jgi:phosphate starvation-inducible membrane PsiE
MYVLLTIAGLVLVVLVVSAYLVGKCFADRKTRRRIMIGTIVVYLLSFIGYFGFITLVISGNVN